MHHFIDCGGFPRYRIPLAIHSILLDYDAGVIRDPVKYR
jgi:hypothetical protein